ncbi:hypothetical protein [Wuhan arthropod virus 1]|uniref:hypothetical protein n=1 Tax=Wuhan arthropod virus 1 TaxID=1923690 RepID=UPI00090BF6F8|nr:hypothetical protein [Wuhan arthropod virus 1]APG77759.1 hypothetical protein [Wuhan arthropod virus 1]
MSVQIEQKDPMPISAITVADGIGGKIPITDNESPSLISTGTGTTFVLRKAIPPVNMVKTGSEAGNTLFIENLDGLHGEPILTSLKTMFMKYRYVDLAIEYQCVAPFATASGSAQTFINPDPENPITTKPDDNLKTVMRLFGSKQLTARGEGGMHVEKLALSGILDDWRYCKPATTSNIRMEEFGQVGLIVRAPPAIGDGTNWSVTLVATVQFKDATFNSTSAQFRTDIEVAITTGSTKTVEVTNTGNYMLTIQSTILPVAGINTKSAGRMIFNEQLLTYVTLADSNNQDTLPLSLHDCDYVITATEATFLLPVMGNSHIPLVEPITIKSIGFSSFKGIGYFTDTVVAPSRILNYPIARKSQDPDIMMNAISSSFPQNIVSKLIKSIYHKENNDSINFD